MKQFNALEKEWIKMLAGEDETIILKTMHEIRNSGSVNMLPYVFNLLGTSRKDTVRSFILQFIGDLKTQEAVPFIVGSVDELENTTVFSQFLSACWQSGLDFSAHISRFAEVFARADYQTSLEAFTIIEESLPYAEEELKMKCLLLLKSAQKSISQKKYPLFLELIRTIQNF